MDFLTLIWVGTKKKQWHLLLELLSSGEIRRGCISKLEERLQLDYHFSPIAALLLESCVHYCFRKCACPAGSDSGLFWGRILFFLAESLIFLKIKPHDEIVAQFYGSNKFWHKILTPFFIALRQLINVHEVRTQKKKGNWQTFYKYIAF